MGYGSDQIISARIIDAKGELVTVSEDEQANLLYALRGAGQFFGLVTELVIKAYPLKTLGNNEGLMWKGSFIFPISRAEEVAATMEELMDDATKPTAGLLMAMAPPPNRIPLIIVAARYTGNPDDAKSAYKALHDLNPLMANGGPVPIQNISDGNEAFNAHGSFKRFGVVGLRRFDKVAFLKVVGVWQELIAECPDAINTSFNFQWDARLAKEAAFESANSLHDIRYWQ